MRTAWRSHFNLTRLQPAGKKEQHAITLVAGVITVDNANRTQKIKRAELMNTHYSMCLLTQGNGSEAVFLTSEVNLQPHQRFAPKISDEVLLASGFPSLSPDTGFPLSPTLQLNAECTTLSDTSLEAIAHAEYQRNCATSFRSYTVEPDRRLCVLASDPDHLDRFVETYGGLLDLEPVLLSGVHPDFDRAVELSISKQGKDFSIDYAVKQPINFKKCTYCGSCGIRCSEQCIDEQLSIDFTRCNLCRECEEVCSSDALDVHSVEERVLTIPAIMVLDGTTVDLSEYGQGVYQEKDINDFLQTQFTCQVDEVISTHQPICQYSGRLDKGCSQCIELCRYDAISRESGGIVIDAYKCEECGGCVAACPTGSLQYERFSDVNFIDFFFNLPTVETSTIVIGEEAELHKFWWQNKGTRFDRTLFLEYPKVSALSLFHLLFLSSRNFSRIILLSNDMGYEYLSSSTIISQANALLEAVGAGSQPVSVSNLQELSSTLETISELKREHTPFSFTPGNRRGNLSAVAEYLIRGTDQPVILPDSAPTPFAEVTCKEQGCTHCFACINICKIGAFKTDEQEVSLIHQPSLCTGCNGCVTICPENVLSLFPVTELSQDYFNDKEHATADPMLCTKCGKKFGTRQGYERVMQILGNKESFDTSHFEYCDTCRVTKLFEVA